MPDDAADPTTNPDSPSGDRTVQCPSCGAEVQLRPVSYGVDEDTRGLACPSCGEIVAQAG